MPVREKEVDRLISNLQESDNWDDGELISSVGSCLRRALLTTVENIHKSKLLLAYHIDLGNKLDKSIKKCLIFLLQSTAKHKHSDIYYIIENIKNIMLEEGMLSNPNLIFILGDHEIQKKYIIKVFPTQKIEEEKDFKRLLRDTDGGEGVILKLRPLASQSAVCPFYHVGPCEPDMFVGREDIIKDIVFGNKVAHAVSGGRRIGKSSLLFKIIHDVTQGVFSSVKYHPLYVDCSNFKTFQELTGHITRKLFPQIYHTKKSVTLLKREIIDKEKSAKKKAYSTGRIDFKFILSRTQLKGRTLLLLLDEMDPLIRKTKIKSEDRDYFFNSIRAETNKSRIKFIISGFRHVSDMINDSTHPFNNLCIGTQLEPLTKEETELLVTLPLLKYDISIINEEKIIDRIFKSTGGHPSVIQFIARHLFLHRQGNIIAESDLNKAYKDKEMINFVLDNFLMNTNTLERLLCLFFVNGDEITLKSAVTVFNQENISFNNMDKKINGALRNLRFNNIFSQDENRYQFLFPSMKAILKNYYDAPLIRYKLMEEVKSGF